MVAVLGAMRTVKTVTVRALGFYRRVEVWTRPHMS
jgi:hypothetical protein